MMQKVLGYKRGTSAKSGNEYCMIFVLRDLTDHEKSNGNVGQIVDTLFAPPDQMNYMQPDMVGKEIICDYDFAGGRGYLRKISVK